LKRLIVLIVLVVAALYGALHYHVVLTHDGLVVERKEEISFEDTFADTRSWEARDWLRHPRLAKALARRHAVDLTKTAGQAIEKAGEELEKLGKQIKK
jgi:hypothetical protein